MKNNSIALGHVAQNTYKARLIFKEHLILYIMFFAFGFNKAIVYLPLIALFYFLKFPKLPNIKIKKSYIYLVSLYSAFLLSLVMIGYSRLLIDSPEKTIIAIMLPILFGGIIFQYQSYDVKIKLLGFYLFGLFLENFLVVAYSFSVDHIKYGYGNLISPFTDEELNSPGTSNMLAISTGYFYFMAIYNKDNFFIKLFSLGVIVLSLMAAVFLGGRTFFLMLSIVILLYFFSQLTIKNLFYFLVTIVIVSFIIIYAITTNEFLQYYLEFTLQRFDNGLESSRFLHYSHGFEMLPQYPFGGFEVDSSIEKTSWYHNIFFDTARVAGWIPIIFFMMALIYTSKFLLYKKINRENILMPFVVAFVTFLVMLQDVVVEGGARSIIILFFASYILIDSKRKTIDRRKII